MFSGTLKILSFTRAAGLVIFAVFMGYIYIQKQDIASLEEKNANLQEQLAICKSENEARDFEAKWTTEFGEALVKKLDPKLELTPTKEQTDVKKDNNGYLSDTF